MNTIFYNAFHAPVGAFATFTLGCRGAQGGLGLELGAPANHDVFIGLQNEDGTFSALPFYEGAIQGEAVEQTPPHIDSSAPANAQTSTQSNDSGEDERARYDVAHGIVENEAAMRRATVQPFADEQIRRDFRVATDSWTAGDLTFTILSPVCGVPDPGSATEDELKLAVAPAVLLEVTVDNTRSTKARQAFVGYSGSDPYSIMRCFDGDDTKSATSSTRSLCGIGQGRVTALVARGEGVSCAQGFSLEDLLASPPYARVNALGGAAVLVLEVPAGEKRTFQIAACFYREGTATANLSTRYFYTRFWNSIEDVAAFALDNFETLKVAAQNANAQFEASHLSPAQRWMLSHAMRSYFGSTQFLEQNGEPLWVVNEGEYRMMNTFDLTVDHLFFEMQMNPWAVRNVLNLFIERYSYRDKVRFPGDETEYPGGLSFTHDMGVANTFSQPEYSSYERAGLKGCFSYMTHEQLVNWLCCATVYVEGTKDAAWLQHRLPIFQECFQSLINRDHPDDAQRNGLMGLDSSRTNGGAEITTYDSLDESLGQARNNIYIAVKAWACYVALEKLFRNQGLEDLAQQAGKQAERGAQTLADNLTSDGYIAAVLFEDNHSKIIPAIEGLVFPLFTGCEEALDKNGRFGHLIQALATHLQTVLEPGVCLFPDGGWKLSSTSENSWLSKVYLCQFVARRVLDLPAEDCRKADDAHQQWLLRPENIYWAWSDQMVNGIALGSKYYPRGVTSILWLQEKV